MSVSLHLNLSTRLVPEHPVMVISDELLFSDREVLKVYGGIPALPEQALEEILIRVRRGEQWSGGHVCG